MFESTARTPCCPETHGRGVVLDKKNRAAYMLLARTDVGPGAELKPYRQVLMFGNPETLGRFMASGSPADTSSDPGITVYRLDIKGVSAQADWGARYFGSRSELTAWAIGLLRTASNFGPTAHRVPIGFCIRRDASYRLINGLALHPA